MALVTALLPIVSAKVGELLYKKIEDADINSKVKKFLGSKFNNPIIEKFKSSRKLKKLGSEKEFLKNKLDFETERLNKLNQIEADYKDITKQTKKVTKLKEDINRVDSLINQELESQIDNESNLETDLTDLQTLDVEKNVNETLQSSLLDNLDEKEKQSQDALSNLQPNTNEVKVKSKKRRSIKTTSSDNKYSPKNLSGALPIKKSRNIKKQLGRPIGSKNKSKFLPEQEEISSDGKEERNLERPSFIDSIRDNSFSLGSLVGSSNNNIEEVDIQKSINKKLLVNSNEQLEELEKVNKNLKDLNKNLANSSGGTTFLGGGLGKIASMIGKLGVATAAIGSVVAGGKAIYDTATEFFSKKKDLKEKLEKGEISQEEYDKETSKNNTKTASKAGVGVGGALAGAAAGAAIGSVIPGVGTVLGGIIGAGLGAFGGIEGGGILGDYLNEKKEKEENKNLLDVPSPVVSTSEKEDKTPKSIYNIENYNKYGSTSEVENKSETLAKNKNEKKEKEENKNLLDVPSPINNSSNLKTTFESSSKTSQERINETRMKRINALTQNQSISDSSYNSDVSIQESNLGAKEVLGQIKNYDNFKEKKDIEYQNKISPPSPPPSPASNTTIIRTESPSNSGRNDFQIDDNISAQLRYTVNN